MKISIEKLGTDNRNSEIINEMCSIDVKKTHLNYRPINVTDMTPSYITGINWINPRYGYSFRWVIRPETWSSAGSNAATYNIPSSQIKEIQNSNSRIGPDAYLGTCDTTLADGISRQFCG